MNLSISLIKNNIRTLQKKTGNKVFSETPLSVFLHISKVKWERKLIPGCIFVRCLRAVGAKAKMEVFTLLWLVEQKLRTCKMIHIHVVQSRLYTSLNERHLIWDLPGADFVSVVFWKKIHIVWYFSLSSIV